MYYNRVCIVLLCCASPESEKQALRYSLPRTLPAKSERTGKRLNHMKKIDLTKYGITGTTEIVYNPSFDELYQEEIKPELTGYERGS